MFRRRYPLTKRQKLRQALWPSMGLLRLTRYYRHRIGRLPGTPEFIARGAAIGVAVSFTPLVGLHMVVGAGLCWLLRGSVLAMVLGTFVGGNLWTLPLIWIGSYKLGMLLLGQEAAHARFEPARFSARLLIEQPGKLLLPMALGSVPMVALAGTVSYYAVREIMRSYRKARGLRRCVRGEAS